MRAGAAAAALACLALLAPAPAQAARIKVAAGSGVTTGFPGQRNVVTIPNVGTWIFYHEINSTRAVWRFTADGLNFTPATDLFPFLSLAPDVGGPDPSV